MLKNLSVLLFAICISISSQATQLQFPYVPDPELTTGSFCTTQDRDYIGKAYPEKIDKCGRAVTQSTKKHIYELYGVKPSCQKNYTIDHFIPLSIGGNNNIANLWPEAKSVKGLRQNLELHLFEKLRDGKITQAEAIRIIRQEKLHPPIEEEMDFCL